jgi:hypothetical protein
MKSDLKLVDERGILDAFERAIAPLDESASMLTLNDDLLELIIEELVPEDDKVRRLGVDHFILLLDICTPDAYELAMLISDCHQAGHSWHGTLEQLSARHDAELVAA